MLSTGPAKKVTIYVNEDTQSGLGPLYETILQFLRDRGVSGATAVRAIAGFGSHRVIHTPKIEALSEHLPVRIEFVEVPEKVEALLPALQQMVGDGLIEVEDTYVVQPAQPAPAGAQLRRERRQGPGKMLLVFLGEAEEWEGRPLHEAIVDRLRSLEIAGATVCRGILGYGAKGHTHKKSFWHPMRDLPLTITVVDTEEKLRTAIEAIESMLQDGLMVLSDIEMIRLLRTPVPESGAHPEDAVDEGI